MSLINEALKKAQRSRTGDAAGHLPPVPGDNGHRLARRNEPRTAQQLILLSAAAIALVVLSVVATVYLVNRPPEPKPVAATPKPSVPAPSAGAATPPPVVAPVLNPPVLTTRPATVVAPPVAQSPAPAPSVAVQPPRPAPPAESPVRSTTPAAPAVTPPASTPTPVAPTTVNLSAVAAAQPVTAVPPASAAPLPAPPAEVAVAAATIAPVPSPKFDERINAFVDAIRVAGIRSSGTESRVLMNDRVYRVNEIVERNFGLRLTKVEANSLTFTDASGVVYVKNF